MTEKNSTITMNSPFFVFILSFAAKFYIITADSFIFVSTGFVVFIKKAQTFK